MLRLLIYINAEMLLNIVNAMINFSDGSLIRNNQFYQHHKFFNPQACKNRNGGLSSFYTPAEELTVLYMYQKIN
jgi:hypothetical protein